MYKYLTAKSHLYNKEYTLTQLEMMGVKKARQLDLHCPYCDCPLIVIDPQRQGRSLFLRVKPSSPHLPSCQKASLDEKLRSRIEEKDGVLRLLSPIEQRERAIRFCKELMNKRDHKDTTDSLSKNFRSKSTIRPKVKTDPQHTNVRGKVVASKGSGGTQASRKQRARVPHLSANQYKDYIGKAVNVYGVLTNAHSINQGKSWIIEYLCEGIPCKMVLNEAFFQTNVDYDQNLKILEREIDKVKKLEPIMTAVLDMGQDNFGNPEPLLRTPSGWAIEMDSLIVFLRRNNLASELI